MVFVMDGDVDEDHFWVGPGGTELIVFGSVHDKDPNNALDSSGFCAMTSHLEIIVTVFAQQRQLQC